MLSQGKTEEMLGKVSTLSVRLHPKYRYLVTLAAREQDTTLTNFIEQAVMKALESDDASHLPNEWLWDDDPAIRLFLLARARPDLLIDVDRRIWRRAAKMPELLNVEGAIDSAKLSANWTKIIRQEE